MSSKIRKKSGIITVSTREEYLRQRAASQEPLIIKLTNHVAFRKVFKNKIALDMKISPFSELMHTMERYTSDVLVIFRLGLNLDF